MNGLDTHDPLSSDNIKLEDCTKSEDININNDVSPRSFSDVEELWSKKSLDNYSDDDLSVSSGKDAKTCALSDEQTKSSQHKSLQNPDVNESPNENGELTGIASDDDVSSVSTVILQCEDNDVNHIPKNDKLIADDGNSLGSTVSFDDGNLNNKPNSKEQHTDDAKSSFGTLVLESIEEINVDDGSKSGVHCNDDETSLVSSQDIFNSDCDDSKSNDIFLEIPIVDVDKIKNQNDTINPVIHEINSDNSDNDDCVVTSVEKLKTPVKRKNVNKATITTAKLRRSGRAVSKKKYTDDIEEIDDESDLEEIIVKNTPIKPKTANSKAKLPPGTTTKTERKLDPRDPLATKSHPERKDANIPQSRKSTSIISKNNNNVTAPQPIQEIKPPEPILPTLTDDMFVVEAPSFIIPYVYEKPAPILLKEFVAKWSKEMDELNIKLENQFKETQKAEQEKREKEKQERQERRERGEIVPNSEEEDIEKKESNNEKKSEKKVKRRRKRDDDDVSWDGSGSEESDDESISDDGSQKDAVINEIPEVKQLVTPRKIDPYFETTLGKFFIDIGTNLIQEYVQTDLLHQQKLKLRREMRAGRNIKKLQSSVTLLSKNLELSQKNNKSFKFEQKQCKICNYKSESALALESHRRTLHMRNNMYICSFCPFEVLGPYNMITHMDTVHAIRGIYDPPPATNQCTQCMFEVQGKSKLSRHLINCEKKFKPSTNLAPPPEWEPPAKILKISNVRAPVPYHTAQFTRLAQVGTTLSGAPVRISIDNALTSPTFRPRMAFTPPRLPGITIKHATTLQNNSSVGDATKKSSNSIIMNPSSQQDGPIQNQNSNTKNIVMCEICDGYIKNLEQLRNHMQWVHKVKIHPKMINNRPPLNCQKCQFRFFTDQGLERHLLGAHGLVTSAIQELANKGKDGGRCPVCGRAYQKKLLAHVSRDHSLVLKPANLSYKCTVCMATFGLYRQFESHVYSAHSTVVKKDNKKIVLKGKTNNIVAPNGAAK